MKNSPPGFTGSDGLFCPVTQPNNGEPSLVEKVDEEFRQQLRVFKLLPTLQPDKVKYFPFPHENTKTNENDEWVEAERS